MLFDIGSDDITYGSNRTNRAFRRIFVIIELSILRLHDIYNNS